jgi:hypothetical protein
MDQKIERDFGSRKKTAPSFGVYPLAAPDSVSISQFKLRRATRMPHCRKTLPIGPDK